MSARATARVVLRELGAVVEAHESEMVTRLPVHAELDEAVVRILDRHLIGMNGQLAEDHVADRTLVSVVSFSLINLLLRRRNVGLGGWHALPVGANERFAAELAQHLAEGRMLEVIRLAAIIHARKHLYGTAA